MTLLRQLMLVVVFLFVVLFSANFVFTVYDSRQYLEQQLQVHAQDTATSLGLSMTTAMAEQDNANLELLASAVFDRGYFFEISLKDVDGEMLINRKSEVKIDNVPHWFIDLIELPTPAGKSEISSGWSQLGTLTIRAHPGNAYRDLWRITKDFFYLFCVITIASYGLIGLVLNFVMRPLRQVEHQADEICERRFMVLDNIPRTRELKRIVEAMNRMSVKLKDMFERQLHLTEQLREEASLDSVTGLVNRKEFAAVVGSVLSSESGSGASALMILSINRFDLFNNSMGREAADELLSQIAQRLTESFRTREDVVIGRHAGADFAIFMSRVDLERTRADLERAFQSVASLSVFTVEEHRDDLHMGAVFSEQSSSLSELLTGADTALRNAQVEGRNASSFLVRGDAADPVSALIKQAGEWHETLKDAIVNNAFLFHYQPIYHLPNQTLLAQEIFVRLETNGEIVNAGVFMPMAQRFGLLEELDRLIIAKALNQLSEASPVFVINLSTRSLQDESFNLWLMNRLSEYSVHAEKIIFELQEHSIHLAYESVRRLVETASALGYRFSVDHFGSGATNFAYLQSLDLHFIKFDRSFVTGIQDNRDNQFFIESVVQIARSRDMQLIAEGVEQAEELQMLIHLGVDAAMGYLLGRPGPDLIDSALV